MISLIAKGGVFEKPPKAQSPRPAPFQPHLDCGRHHACISLRGCERPTTNDCIRVGIGLSLELELEPGVGVLFELTVLLLGVRT